jgi:2-hydroxychromene-2-carboxylate isomerase
MRSSSGGEEFQVLFFVDDEIHFGKDRLRGVEEAIAAKK